MPETSGVSDARFTIKKPNTATRLVLLVTAAVFINYIDRGNLATAAPLMQDELRLSASQLGVLLSAFYYGYVVCMPAMGWLAERYGAKRILGLAVTIWSIATLSTGGIVSRLVRHSADSRGPQRHWKVGGRAECRRQCGGTHRTRAHRHPGRSNRPVRCVAFGLAAAVNVLGFIGWVFVLPKIEPLQWKTA